MGKKRIVKKGGESGEANSGASPQQKTGGKRKLDSLFHYAATT